MSLNFRQTHSEGYFDSALGKVYESELGEEILDLSQRGKDLSDEELGEIVRKNPYVQNLSLANCNNISDQGLYYIKELKLQYLNLDGCYKITDIGISYLENMPLNCLILSFCDNVTDKGLVYLSGMPLQFLDISENLNISDDGSGFCYKEDRKLCGNGISNMKERVLLLNGKIEIVSNKRFGTRIKIEIPLIN